MNEMAAVQDPRTPATAQAPKGAEATLASFLDTADRLYERIGAALGRVGLSYPKYELLEHLKNSAEPVSLGVLADGQSCARSNITQLVDKLEIEGLVRRVADPEDRRAPLRHVDRRAVGQGLLLAAVAGLVLVVMANGGLGGSESPLFLVPWFVLLAGGWRAATALLAR